MILKMIDFSREKHAGQVRRGSGEPYITHPMEVSYLLVQYKESKRIKELICACWGHDLLEDTDTTAAELLENFGPLVLSLVYEMTNDENEIALIGKHEYLKKKLCGLSSYGLVIKLADRLHNVMDAPGLKYVNNTIDMVNHLRSNRKLSRSQDNLCSAILTVCRGFIDERQKLEKKSA